jgi:hypothetical protein
MRQLLAMGMHSLKLAGSCIKPFEVTGARRERALVVLWSGERLRESLLTVGTAPRAALRPCAGSRAGPGEGARLTVVVVARRGGGQPAGTGSALSLANACARSRAQGQLALRRSFAWRPWKASRAAT